MAIGFVYKWTNTKNGMWYVGSHAGTINDGYVGGGVYFNRVVKEHGLKIFKRKILYVGTKFREREHEFLLKTDAMNNKKSYNLKNAAIGGAWNKGKNNTKEEAA